LDVNRPGFAQSDRQELGRVKKELDREVQEREEGTKMVASKQTHQQSTAKENGDQRKESAMTRSSDQLINAKPK